MTTLRINLLGPLHVTIDGASVAFRTDAQRVLLAYLAAHAGTPLRRDALAALLSPERNDKDALTYLRNRLTRLRQALQNDATPPGWLTVDRKQIALRVGDDITVDTIRFEQLLAGVERHAHRTLAGCPGCLTQLQEATGLVRGEFLAGLNFPSEPWEAWLLAQREHVQQRALEAMAQLRDARMARGEWEAALDVAQQQLGLEPWDEAAHRAQMTAHYHLGDRNAALAGFAQCQQVLWEELGVEPEAETRQLRQDILDGRLARLSGPEAGDNLPPATGAFFGRQAETERLLHLLVDPAYRLITLVGPGGIGKTRLALEVGKAVKSSFPDGVWLVPLGAVEGGPEQIKIAVGEAVGLGQTGRQLTGEQVSAVLREKQLLLILDNCEPVLDELDFLSGWLNRAPGVAILATSREPLNFGAESVVLLAGLPTGAEETGPAETGAAEALFAERGQMARSDFALSAQNLPLVRQICQLVDGLPLGIALAAAWVRQRSLRQIVDSIQESLDFLSTRLRDVDRRHRSMRAVLETSWQLLGEAEQALLAGLSIFPSSFSFDAAHAVAGAGLADLDLLGEKSLLQQQPEAERYALHSLVRQFAGEKLAAGTPAVEQAFVNYFYGFARTHQGAYDRLQPEWGNFSAAIAKAHGLGEWQRLLAFVAVLDEGWFRQIRFQEMRAGLALALDAAAAQDDQAARARTLLRLGEVETELNDYAAAEAHLSDALRYFLQMENGEGIAQAKYLLGRVKLELSYDGEALSLLTEARQILEEAEDPLGVAQAENVLAVSHMKRGDDSAARACLERSVALLEPLPITASYAMALRYLARLHSVEGLFPEAGALLNRAAQASQALADLGEYAAVLYERTVLHKRWGQWETALAAGEECLDLFQKVGSLRWQGLVQTQLGLVHQSAGNAPQALALFEQALQIFIEVGDRFEQAYAHYFLARLYAQTDDRTASLAAKEQAQRLNSTLRIPNLDELLRKL